MAKEVKDKQFIFQRYIQKGIDRYNGVKDDEIQRHLDNADWKYTAYLFEDKRVLLVYHDDSYGVLYRDLEYLYEIMDL